MTIAGDGTPGFSGDGGPATKTELNYPTSTAFDVVGICIDLMGDISCKVARY